MAARRTVRWNFLGRLGYREALALQHRLRDGVQAGTGPEHLLLLEHDPVYTLGRNAREGDILAPREWLASRGVAVEECDRGGQVTYHGPGQLVAYPILNLSPDRRDVRRYVRDLQEVLVRTLGDFGIEGRRREGKAFVGVWVGDRKIASIGVHLSRWVTTHGFALNVAPDLSRFTGIVPCGLTEVEMTSIAAETGETPTPARVAARAAFHLGEVFDREMDRAPIERAPSADRTSAAAADAPSGDVRSRGRAGV